MTVKRNNDGDLEILKQGLGTSSFRFILLAVFISQTPIADDMWKTIGMKSLATQIAELATKINVVEKDIKGVHEHVATIDQRFGVFEVNFEKYKAAHP